MKKAGPCQLCNRDNNRYFYLSASSVRDLVDIIKKYNPNVDPDEAICNACRMKYSRKLKSAVYTPEKNRKKSRPPCYLSKFSMCVSSSEIESDCNLELFNVTFSLQCASIPQTIHVCRRHRSEITNAEVSSNAQFCLVCETKISSESKKKYMVSNLSEKSIGKLKNVNNLF